MTFWKLVWAIVTAQVIAGFIAVTLKYVAKGLENDD